MKKQIQDFLTGAGEHHAAMAKAHQTAADGYEADSTPHVFHKTAMDSHTNMADVCLAACKVLQNADLSDFEKRDFKNLMPTPISAVTPDAPAHAHLRRVPRAGQPEPQTPIVSDVFSKLISVDE
jgi:hypothetical protein